MSSATFNVIQRSQFIRAGAGAGKTTKLVAVFLDFVKEFRAQHGRWPHLAVTTFTRKATQELKERLLVSALQGGERDVFEFINKKSSVHISTIHGLLSIFLSQHAEKLKFPQDIRIIDSQQYRRKLRRQLNDLIKREQKFVEILEHYTFAELVELTEKALDYTAQFPNFNFVSAEVLKVLAKKMKSEICDDIDYITKNVPDVPEKWQEYFTFLKNLQNLLATDQDDEYFKMLELMPSKPRWNNKTPPFDPLAHARIEDLKDNKFEKAFDSLDYIERHQNLNSLFFEMLSKIVEVVQGAKRTSGEVTISDLETLSLQLIETFPEATQEFSQGWDYFMIDEYQDTSPLQVRILEGLIGKKPSFVVGDPQQSIYLFRGARSEVFHSKQQQMQAQGALMQVLDRNYRTEPPLMSFINDFFTKFSAQFQAMQLKEPSENNKSLPYEVFYVKGEEQHLQTIAHIRYLLAQGIKPQEICVLSRSNSKLNEIAHTAGLHGIAVQLQAAGGFEEQREVLDLLFFNKFLNNPHDDENLVGLLRSPWFHFDDQDILDIAQNAKAQKTSLWTSLSQKNSSHEAYTSLKKYAELFSQCGCLTTTQAFIAETAFVDSSAFYDESGKREANIFKYLMRLSDAEKAPGFSLGLYLDEQFLSLQSDLGSSNAEAQPVIQPDCVSLMTVHASKGLQFPHVIVVGFSDGPQLSKTPHLAFDEDSQFFSLAPLDEVTAKPLASAWVRKLKEKFNERELSENERVLYVAMTRAINSLTLVAQLGARTPPEKSWYRRILWPAEGEHNFETYRALSCHYTDHEAAQSTNLRRTSNIRPPLSTEKAQLLQASSVTDLLSESMSKTQGNSQVDLQQSLEFLKKAQRGSDLHRIFEALKYVPYENLKKRLSSNEQELVDYLYSETSLNFSELLEKGHNEWGFGLKTPQRMIPGQIDLWAETENEVHVLDYKTGSSRYSEKAFDQLSFYTMALLEMKQISSDKKIIHSVVYPVERKTVQKSYANAEDFKKGLREEVKAIFGGGGGEPNLGHSFLGGRSSLKIQYSDSLLNLFLIKRRTLNLLFFQKSTPKSCIFVMFFM